MSAPLRRAPSNFVTSEIQGATHPASHGLRSTLAGIIVNLCLAAIKGIAGVAGQSYALIADAIESLTDVFSSLIVYVGLRVAMRPPDANHPYGHGKAEPMAAVGVSIFLFAAAVAIAVESIHEIRIPQRIRRRLPSGIAGCGCGQGNDVSFCQPCREQYWERRCKD